MSKIKCNGPCGRELEHTTDNFYSYKSSSGKKLLRTTCKECTKKRETKRYRKKVENNIFYNQSSFGYKF